MYNNENTSGTNTESNRIYKKPVNLGYNDTKAFFTNRAKRKGQIALLNITMYQDKNPSLAEERDYIEKKKVIPYLMLTANSRVLDIGCGVGRWGFYIAKNIREYLGIDFSDELIEIAKTENEKIGYPMLHFQTLSATSLLPNCLSVAPPFSHFIIAGVMAYLNDMDCIKMLNSIRVLSDKSAILYIREPVAINQRLTLINLFSEELETHYNAIYRTHDEYMDIFSNTVLKNGFKLFHQEELLSDTLKNQKETTQNIYFFKNWDS